MTDYRAAGVDLSTHAGLIDRIAALAAQASRPEVLAAVGPFAGAFAEDAQSALVASTDSVGTKVLLAAAAGRFAAVGRDVVIHCANDVATSGARPLFFLDYLAVASLEPAAVLELISGVAGACRDAGCALLGGETAQLPDLYRPGTFDLAGTMVGRVPRRLIGPPRGRPGDVVLGIPSSGPHTNGYSLIRRILADRATDAGPWLEALLAPSRLYSTVVATLLDAGLEPKAMAHITGGGLGGNLDRALAQDTDAVLDLATWGRPAVFDWLAELGGVAEAEMRRVFNLGIGYVLVTGPGDVAGVRQLCPDAVEIGALTAGSGQVHLTGQPRQVAP